MTLLNKCVVGILGLFLVSCTLIGNPQAGRSAVELLPDLSQDYHSPEVGVMIDAFKEVGILVSTITANPILAAKIGAIDSIASCVIERQGVAAMRFYVHKTYSEAAGLILVINQDRLTSVENALACLNPINHLVSEPHLNPCLEAWEYRENDATYYILYAGTAQLICYSFKDTLPRN